MSGSSGGRRHIFVNRYFWPDHSATSQILGDVAFDLAARGEVVTVIASRMRYDDPQAKLPARQTRRGVSIRRVWTTRFGRTGLVGRALDYASFYVSASWTAWRLARPGDNLVVKTDPPMLSVPMALVARVRGARMIAWLQDLYPEVAAALGFRLLGGSVGGLLRAIRNASLRQAHRSVAIGGRMAELLRANGVPAPRIAVIHNWADDDAIRPAPTYGRALRREWGFADSDLVIGYSGNLGRAHEVATMLDAARLLHEWDGIRFLFIGGGHLRAKLEAEAARRRLTNIVCKPYQPFETIMHSLAVPDIHWMSLRPELEGMIVPSKFYGAAASGRAIVYVGDPDGEIARVIAQAGCGITIEPGHASQLAAVLSHWAESRDELARMGARARGLIEQSFRKADALSSWHRLLTA